MLEVIGENMEWFFSGIGTLIVSLIASMHYIKNNSNKECESVEDSAREAPFSKKEDYKTTLGKRHKFLRENILKLSLREMTEFYGFNSVSELEKYECGEQELPLEHLRKVERFFFLNPKFLELGEKPIFEMFSLFDNSLEILWNDGFLPMIACCQGFRDNLFAYVVLSKEENGFMRIVVSDVYGAFMSTGGGKLNLEKVIYEQVKRKISLDEISILRASESEWKALEAKSYYDKRLFHGFGAADWDCMDIYAQWYKDMDEKMIASAPSE